MASQGFVWLLFPHDYTHFAKKCFHFSIRIMLYTPSVFLGSEIKDILYAVHLFTGVYIMQNTLVLGGGENTASITILNIGLKSPRRYQPLRQYTLLCPFTTMCTHIALQVNSNNINMVLCVAGSVAPPPRPPMMPYMGWESPGGTTHFTPQHNNYQERPLRFTI